MDDTKRCLEKDSQELEKKCNAMQIEINKKIDNVNIYEREAIEFNNFICKQIYLLVHQKDLYILNAIDYIIANITNFAMDFKMSKIREKKQKKF